MYTYIMCRKKIHFGSLQMSTFKLAQYTSTCKV